MRYKELSESASSICDVRKWKWNKSYWEKDQLCNKKAFYHILEVNSDIGPTPKFVCKFHFSVLKRQEKDYEEYNKTYHYLLAIKNRLGISLLQYQNCSKNALFIKRRIMSQYLMISKNQLEKLISMVDEPLLRILHSLQDEKNENRK